MPPNKTAGNYVEGVEGVTREVSGQPSLSAEIEIELIAKAQQGDRQAFGELVRRHREGVINVVYRMCGDANLAEDAAQEAFIRAWQHLPSYRPRSPFGKLRAGSFDKLTATSTRGGRAGSFRNWVYRIATNAARDLLRRERETVDIDALSLPTPDEGPETITEQGERGERVRQAVLALPPASRAVLVLREYEGLSYREIADTLGIPIGTVMSRLNYARGWLRKSLSPYLEVL